MDKIWIKKKVLSEWIEKERKNIKVKSKKKNEKWKKWCMVRNEKEKKGRKERKVIE